MKPTISLPATEPQTRTCPACRGGGDYQPGPDPSYTITCPACGGTGSLPQIRRQTFERPGSTAALAWIAERIARYLEGPTVPFTDPPATRQAGEPPVDPATLGARSGVPAAGPAAVASPSAAARVSPPSTPQGAATPTHATNCLFVDDWRHECVNSYGEPVREGQDCYASARRESRRSFLEAHPTWKERI